eukprot:1160107-Pelagomonas_calceolata.AAC.2
MPVSPGETGTLTFHFLYHKHKFLACHPLQLQCPLSQAMQTIRSRNMYRRRDASLELDMTDLAAGAGTQASRFGPEGTKECQELFWEGARFGIELAQQAKAPR